MQTIPAEVEVLLTSYQVPYLQQDLMTSKLIKNAVITADKISLDIVLGYPAAGIKEKIIAELRALLAAVTKFIDINLSWKIEPHLAHAGLPNLPNVKNIIAIASGKGGVGKSTTAVNLALALNKEGARVGILDADIYGPNQPQMLGGQAKPEIQDDKRIIPIIRYDIQSMSIGYLVDMTTAMVWRGPMISTAFQQLLRDTVWDDLDYLVIDLPPGTGDIQLTLAQKVPLNGAIMITTPQDLALLDVRRGIEMFTKVKVPVLGVIENMGVHICSHCGHPEPIFGSGGGERVAAEYKTELLGQLPLAISIRQATDAGKPSVVAEPEGDIAGRYREIARKIAAKIALQPKSYSGKFPKIVVEND